MKRIHLTTEDLLRIRVGAPLGALGETMLATRTVQRGGSAVYDGWRRQVWGAIPDDFRILASIVPPDEAFIDLITPTRGARTMPEGITALHLASREEIRREVKLAAERRDQIGKPFPAWAAQLPDRDAEAMRNVAAAVDAFHTVAFAGRWGHVQSFLDVTADRMARTMATEGVERLFGMLAPHVRWRAPILEVYTLSGCHDDHPGGRGLVIVPSLFAGPAPILLHSTVDLDAPKMLIVPALRDFADFAAAWGPRESNEALIALLGRTRAAALETIAEGCSTTELARKLGVTAATASEHASILREAGLIESRRHRNSVRHQLTTLGAALLDGDLGSGIRIA
ncbi:winged helix-turn-helix domain-containing protein [Nocardia sp. NPDC052566]|uniref:winged helix-turn-helix domain-containing protein n=1 Tax=Nocardia sp. NPDC052566 TaxID=3364330 RepID=UPI0037CC085E